MNFILLKLFIRYLQNYFIINFDHFDRKQQHL
jgi:hypothetical protein